MGALGTRLPLPQPGFQLSSLASLSAGISPALLIEEAPGNRPPPPILQGHLGKMRYAEIRGREVVLGWLNKLSSGLYQKKSVAVLVWGGDGRIFRLKCGLGWGIRYPVGSPNSGLCRCGLLVALPREWPPKRWTMGGEGRPS